MIELKPIVASSNKVHRVLRLSSNTTSYLLRACTEHPHINTQYVNKAKRKSCGAQRALQPSACITHSPPHTSCLTPPTQGKTSSCADLVTSHHLGDGSRSKEPGFHRSSHFIGGLEAFIFNIRDWFEDRRFKGLWRKQTITDKSSPHTETPEI